MTPDVEEIVRRVAARDRRYSTLTSGAPGPAMYSLPCVHEGAVLEYCKSCTGERAERKHVRDCDLYDKCTRETVGPVVRGCDRCPDYAAFRPVTRRHLIYHVLPVSHGGAWKLGVDQLRNRWPLFTGSKTVAVMTDPKRGWLDHPDEVREYLPPGCAVVEIPNNPDLREVASWEPLWERALSAATDDDAILYCHAKGVTRPLDPGNSCHWWSSLLYSLHLDHWSLVKHQLERHPVTGAFKKLGRCFTGSRSAWHYSGSFFWVRAGDFRTRPWRAIDRRWWGNEAWPGLAYKSGEAGAIFYEAPREQCDVYDPDFWANVIRPRYSEWLQSNRPTWPWIGATAPSAGG